MLTDGDLQWNDKLVAAASPVDVNSAGAIQKQANIHHDGENISAKIDQIRQQNDWLFIRKLKVSIYLPLPVMDQSLGFASLTFKS